MSENERDALPSDPAPMVVLGPWRAFRSPMGKLHIASELGPGSVRITSSLSGVDRVARIAKTSSGNLYRFVSPPAQDQVTCGMLADYAGRAGLAGAKDVSAKLWEAIEEKTAERAAQRAAEAAAAPHHTLGPAVEPHQA
ncbi:hypothetical protein OU995_01580 [Roseateles sp. SL47]|uniref:hypothetical protein n=1 Tax=Roseateles sp. SL47 TaxID=2995138 RepID=UPI00226F2F10|nr:hypothetical protein [Roseateles sp. SL47]WAC73467.1 hypothetical protein OU995_01580 [Roseateles sp. SL47]